MTEYGWEPDFYKRGGGSTRGGMPWVTFRAWLRVGEERAVHRLNEHLSRTKEQRRRQSA